MSAPIECVECYNWGTTDESGWTSMIVGGRTEWHCPNCLRVNHGVSHSESQAVAIVEQALPSRELPVAESTAAAHSSSEPMPAERLTLRERWNSFYVFNEPEIRNARFAIGVALGVCLALGVISGLVNGDVSRAVLAALGGGLLAGAMAAIVVVGAGLASEGDTDSWLSILGIFLIAPLFFAAFAAVMTPFVAFATIAERDFPSTLSALPMGVFFVGISALAGLPFQILFMTIGMLNRLTQGGELSPGERIVAWILAAFYVLSVLAIIGSVFIRQQLFERQMREEYERYEEEERRSIE